MSEDPLTNIVLSAFSLGGLIYYSPKAIRAFKKWLSSAKAYGILEDESLEPKTVDQLLKSSNSKNLDKQLVWLQDKAESILASERRKAGAPTPSGLDLWVRTTELSHGFECSTIYEVSKFYLGGKEKIEVELDDESCTTVVNPKMTIMDNSVNYLYYPFYMLGWTSITSYNIEYLSSGDVINI